MLTKEKEKRIAQLEERLKPGVPPEIANKSAAELHQEVIRLILKLFGTMPDEEFLELVTEISYLREKAGMSVFEFHRKKAGEGAFDPPV